MLTLGIHDGHTATACLMEDGRVVACISEERLNGTKEWSGFPELSIRTCLDMAGKAAADVDAVGVCSLLPQTGHDSYDRPGALKRIFGGIARIAPRSLLRREGNVALAQSVGSFFSSGRRRLIEDRLRSLGLSCPHRFYEHHGLHAATACYTNWYRPDPCLVLTLDGSGDAVAGTVSVARNGRIERLSAIFNYNSVCEFYTRITQHLGMRPMSHEYKVMGLAPYAAAAPRQRILELFRSCYRISPADPLQIENTSGAWRWQFLDKLPALLERERFDSVAGAAQDLFEEIVLQWVKNAVAATGIGDLALSGGGFMNVKVNGRILSLPGVKSLFVFPSCGDESNPVGAAIRAALDEGFDWQAVEPLGMIDWGPEYGRGEIADELQAKLPAEGFTVTERDDMDAFVGSRLADGRIVGRLAGRMEWGARALGHRSILADPRSPAVIHRINRAIKKRDFWMPFAPAVLASQRERYLRLPARFRAPFMTVACETTADAKRDLPAGLHPFDGTARAQVVDETLHPRFHRLIEAFREKTGVGAVLNTSFNIHGRPIVCSPGDALAAFLDSDLDALQLEGVYVERQRG